LVRSGSHLLRLFDYDADCADRKIQLLNIQCLRPAGSTTCRLNLAPEINHVVVARERSFRAVWSRESFRIALRFQVLPIQLRRRGDPCRYLFQIIADDALALRLSVATRTSRLSIPPRVCLAGVFGSRSWRLAIPGLQISRDRMALNDFDGVIWYCN
jgi:hypothetical protein